SGLASSRAGILVTIPRSPPRRMMVTLRLLGGMSLTGPSGEEILSLLSHPKQMAVLAYLALEGRRGFVRRELITALFWAESDLSHGRNALNQVLFALRRELGEGVLLTRGKHDIGLDPEHLQCDVWSFLAAIDRGNHEAAFGLYEGELLPGFHVNGGGEFERWLEEERERLREMAAGAAWRTAHAFLSRRELVNAERTAQRALALVWSDETPVRRFISAMAAAGDRAAALRFYGKFCDRLREELEVTPSPQTLEVVERIRDGDTGPPPFFPEPWTAGQEPPPTASGDPGIRDSRAMSSEAFPRDPSTAGDERSPRPSPAGWSRIAWMGLGIPGLILATLWVWPKEPWQPEPDRVAVAHLRNRTGDPALETLGARVSVNLQWKLDRAGIGEVVPPLVVERALLDAGPDADPVQVLSQNAGAGIVVTGDIFLRGDSLLVRTFCMDSRSGKDLHPIEPVTGGRDEEARVAAEIQDRVSAVLAQHFDTLFYLDPALAPPPVSLDAYREYRRGYEVYRLGGTHQDAILHFRRAWEMDPTYLAPPLRILDLYSNRPLLRSDSDSILRALESARHRMTRYQRHYFDGIRLAGEGNLELAYREFLAMAGIGHLQAASALAEMALLTNRPEKSVEAARWLDKGNGEFLEPYVAFWPGYWSFYTYALHMAGEYEKELEIAREWGRRFPGSTYYPVQAEMKARIGLGQLDHLDAAVEAWRAENRLQAIWDLADELRVHGHEEAARTLLEEEARRFQTDSAYIGRFNNQAMVLHRLGRDREAHILWEKGINLDRPDPWPWGVARIGFSAALSGDSAQAREMERLLLSTPGPREGDYAPFLQAKIAAALGEKERAVDILAVWARRGANLAWLNNVHRDFTFQSLLADYPPFQELMRPKG
ncbi:MAG: BTAD domain-containing putative transcriptional regulator, partial [Longimicrobiales bacterium]